MGTLHYLPGARARRRRAPVYMATLANMRKHPSSCMRCRVCPATYGANPSDYFWARPNQPLKCCGRVCALVPKAVAR